MRRVFNIRDNGRPLGCVYIGRAGHGMQGTYGNRHDWRVLGRGVAVLKYEEDVQNDPALRAQFQAELADKDLVCFCAPPGGLGPDDPLKCHGQVILKSLRGDYERNDH